MNSIASFFVTHAVLPWSARIRTREDVESAGLPFLGAIPPFAQAPSSTHPSAAFAEVWDAYYGVESGLQGADSGPRTLVVTSALPEEGKTTTAANLATAMARRGKRVVLVDANLRWPSLVHAGGEPSPGLSELLRNPALDPQHALRRTPERSLYLLPGGEPPAGPETALRSSRLFVILTALKAVADYVIVDAPPLLEGADTTILAKAADATVIVVDTEKCRRRTLTKALNLMSKAGVSAAGAVLNRAANVAPTAADADLLLPEPLLEAPVEAVAGYPPETPVEAVAGYPPETPVEAVVGPLSDAPAEAVALSPSEAPLEVQQPAEAAAVSVDGVAPDAATPPLLRLIQPFERPLLPFGANAAPAPEVAAPVVDVDPLEITVDELLVDLEKTLALIRELKERHANAMDA